MIANAISGNKQLVELLIRNLIENHNDLSEIQKILDLIESKFKNNDYSNLICSKELLELCRETILQDYLKPYLENTLLEYRHHQKKEPFIERFKEIQNMISISKEWKLNSSALKFKTEFLNLLFQTLQQLGFEERKAFIKEAIMFF